MVACSRKAEQAAKRRKLEELLTGPQPQAANGLKPEVCFSQNEEIQLPQVSA